MKTPKLLVLIVGVPVGIVGVSAAMVSLSRVPFERIGAPPAKTKPALAQTSPSEPPFTSGVPGRIPAEACQSTSFECQEWTKLARKCEENMRQREAGFMGHQLPYCSEMETFREQVTGIPDSGSPGAYSF